MIPEEMKPYRQWIIWKETVVNGKSTKVPLSPLSGRFASVIRSEHWGTYPQACQALQKYQATGLGFVFTADDPFLGVDLDSCFDEAGKPTELAKKVVYGLSSYAERSPSGKGVHIIVKASIEQGRHPKGIGIFSRERYFTMTGLNFPSLPQNVESRQCEIDSLLSTLFPEPQATHTPAKRQPNTLPALSDGEILRKAAQARNGAKFEAAFTGDLTPWDGDWSAADIYLMGRLAYWTGKDVEQMIRIFEMSALKRKKTNTRRPIYGSYIRQTAIQAIRLGL